MVLLQRTTGEPIPAADETIATLVNVFTLQPFEVLVLESKPLDTDRGRQTK